MAIYCKGKGAVCDLPCNNEACEHYDGTGAQCIPTEADKIRYMSNQQLAEAIHELYLRISDHEFDLSELWCRPEMHGLCTGSQQDRILFCNTKERMNCILCYLNSPAEEVVDYLMIRPGFDDDRESGLVED